MINSTQLIEKLKISLKKYEININIKNEIIFIICNKKNLIYIVRTLKEDRNFLYTQLTDITAVDYIDQKKRFEIIYLFLSHKYNFRLGIKILLEDNETIESICEIFESANWYERECYDLFGIIFENHPDLRRIMTDYNFIGHPLRKDFPLTGHTEVRYDNLEKKVIYEPVKLEQNYRDFDFESPWQGTKYIKDQIKDKD